MSKFLVKFMYIRREKFSPMTFLEKLCEKLEIERRQYDQIKTIFVYPDGKKQNEFGLRIIVNNRSFIDKLEAASIDSGKEFPHIKINNEKVIYVPPNRSNEKMTICVMKEGSELYGRVLKVQNPDDYDWKMIYHDYYISMNADINYVAIYDDYFYVAFQSEVQAKRVFASLKANRQKAVYSSTYLVATKRTEERENFIIIRRFNNLATNSTEQRDEGNEAMVEHVATESSLIEESKQTTPNSAKRQDQPSIELQQLILEVEALKKQINLPKSSKSTQTDERSNVRDTQQDINRSSSLSSSTSTSTSSSNDSMRVVIGKRVKFAAKTKLHLYKKK